MDWSATNEALDRSGQGNGGNVTNFYLGGVTIGKIGQALDFDGNDNYVDLGDASSMDLPGNMSIFAWIKADDVIATQSIAG